MNGTLRSTGASSYPSASAPQIRARPVCARPWSSSTPSAGGTPEHAEERKADLVETALWNDLEAEA